MTAKTRLLVLQVGDAIPAVQKLGGNFPDMFRERLATADCAPEVEVLNAQLHVPGDRPFSPRDYDGVIMTGGPAMVGEGLPWMTFATESVARVLDAEVPFFGVTSGRENLSQ